MHVHVHLDMHIIASELELCLNNHAHLFQNYHIQNPCCVISMLPKSDY